MLNKKCTVLFEIILFLYTCFNLYFSSIFLFFDIPIFLGGVSSLSTRIQFYLEHKNMLFPLTIDFIMAVVLAFRQVRVKVHDIFIFLYIIISMYFHQFYFSDHFIRIILHLVSLVLLIYLIRKFYEEEKGAQSLWGQAF